jgi:hypothetical protein
MCNDEHVKVIKRDKIVYDTLNSNHNDGEPPRKKARNDENTLQSKDAYMLVYTRMQTTSVSTPPPEIMRSIEAEQIVWEEEQGERYAQKERLEDEYEGSTGAKKQVAKRLAGSEYLVPTAQLERWFGADTIEGLFDPWPVPLCPHGEVDPDATGLYKLVSAEAFEFLQRYGARPTDSDLALINTLNGETSNNSSVQASPATTTVKTVNHFNIPEGNNVELVAKKPVSGRREDLSIEKGPIAESPRGSSTKATSEEIRRSLSANGNGNLSQRKSSSPSGPATFDILPRVSICPQCVEEEYNYKSTPGISAENRDFWKAEVKQDRLISKMLGGQFVTFDVDYYYLPDSFVESWLDFIRDEKSPRPQLPLNLGRCEHGMLDVDLEMDEIRFISEKGWEMLVDK